MDELASIDTGPRPASLARPEWGYVDKRTLNDFRAAEWTLLAPQRQAYYAERQVDHVLALFALERDHPSFGYRINNFWHGLQSATMAHRAGLDEETVVVALLHDVGFLACPTTHGAFAAALLGAYISERNRWMLHHHQIFQQIHMQECPDVDRAERERWRGHEHFAWTAEFVARFDQNAIDPGYETAPLESFAPMVRRIFARGVG